jgi:sirohydrochlorin ferrochelatase
MPASGLILFAHGARDPAWTAPFLRVLARVEDQAPMLAYLELMTPDPEDRHRHSSGARLRRRSNRAPVRRARIRWSSMRAT